MDDLKNVLYEIEKSPLNPKDKEKYFVTQYADISNKYPMIIKKACEEGFDFPKMFWMMEQKNKVDSNEMTQHDASVEVGEVLVNEYIKKE